MSVLTLFLIAVGLSMDACAVSVSNGLCFTKLTKSQAAVMAAAFGMAQALMPVLGFGVGSMFHGVIDSCDHWIAFSILGILGGKMIWEVMKAKKLRYSDKGENTTQVFQLKLLFMQAIATSIDALTVGVGFAVMQVNIWVAATFIGTVTFVCCATGIVLGRRFGRLFGKKAELLGGAILLLIGLKILVEHLVQRI